MTREEELDRLRREYGIQPLSLPEARRFAQMDAEEREKELYNYHKNVYDAMFWSGATKDQLDKYEKEYL